MQYTATLSQSELEKIVSESLKAEAPDIFPHGAVVTFRATEGQREQAIVTATAIPANRVQPKD